MSERVLSQADMGRLHHKCNRSPLLGTCSVTITNKQNNVIDYDYIESNYGYNRDYICLETVSERKQKHICKLSWVYVQTTYEVYVQTTYGMNQCNKQNYQSVRIKYRKKVKSHHLLTGMFVQTANQLCNISLSQGGKLSWKKPTGHFGRPTSQHSEKNLRNDGECGCELLY